MLDLILGALVPILVMFVLGYLAGAHHDFNRDGAVVLNRMVMLYALPLSLFCGLVTTPIQELISQDALALSLLLGMVGFYFIVYFLALKIFKQSKTIAALLALAITGPAVPFVGVSVLGKLFPDVSTIPISLGSVYLNLVQVPITMILVASDVSRQKTSSDGGQKYSFGGSLLNALKQPVVWAPLLAMVLVVARIKFPTVLINSFELLGKATGGVALFASGIILYSYKISFTRLIGFSVLAKNIIVPLAAWGLVLLMGLSPQLVKETVLTISIPTGSIVVMLAIQFGAGEREFASILFFSSALSLVTMGVFMWLLQ